MGCIFKPKKSRFYWIKYVRAGKAYYEGTKSERKGDAIRLLKRREGDIERGLPVTPKIGRLKFDEAAQDVINDFKVNGKRSLREVTRRFNKHLTPFFTGRLLSTITTSDVRAYVAKRMEDVIVVRKARTVRHADGGVEEIAATTKPVSNAEINRELQVLKRAFNLAMQAGKLLHKPHVPMLKEDNVRRGFFEPEMFTAVVRHLPPAIHPVARFAYLTGWRIPSEVLPLEWRQVDFAAGEVRLDPGTTKNGQGRVFPMTRELRILLEEQRDERDRLKKAGHIVPYVFFREIADGRGGEKRPRRIISFLKAWRAACVAAGCPGRIPHDLRRTAVRNLVRVGIPERVAMEMTGHLTRSVFERYNIVSGSDLRGAAARIDEAAATRQVQAGTGQL